MSYCPRRADIVWLSFDPQAGREQAGHRPALVLSPESYNRKTGRAVVCPISSKGKGYAFEISLNQGRKISGVIFADQIKNLDWKARHTKFDCRVSASVFAQVLSKLDALLSITPNGQ